MENISVNRFRDNLKSVVNQETLFVLQNTALMRQITESTRTHARQSGYRPTGEEMNEIIAPVCNSSR